MEMNLNKDLPTSIEKNQIFAVSTSIMPLTLYAEIGFLLYPTANMFVLIVPLNVSILKALVPKFTGLLSEIFLPQPLCLTLIYCFFGAFFH